jgi:hypothetical protein
LSASSRDRALLDDDSGLGYPIGLAAPATAGSPRVVWAAVTPFLNIVGLAAGIGATSVLLVYHGSKWVWR